VNAERDDPGNYWDKLPDEERERLDAIAQSSIMQLAAYPRDKGLVQQLLAWKVLENEVLKAHSDWLARTKARFERRGIEWTVENLNRWSRLWEVE
jgi:hypothetical protein